MPRDTWWNLPEPKRTRVLEAAMAEFGRRGFSAGSLNVVAREAHIAKGSLFQYFEDKLDLFTSTCAAAADRIRDEVLRSVDPDAELFDLLRQIANRWLDYFWSHPLERGVAFAAGNEVDRDARSAVRGVANTHFVDALGPLLKQAVARDELDPSVDPNDVMAMVILVLRHLDTAPFVADIDPVLGLNQRPLAEVKAIADRLISALARAYAAKETVP